MNISDDITINDLKTTYKTLRMMRRTCYLTKNAEESLNTTKDLVASIICDRIEDGEKW